MNTYAGIGSRSITKEEKTRITNIANYLSDSDYICYSGNANGSDIAFQRASKGKCVVWLPWENFNYAQFNADDKSLVFDSFVMGDSEFADSYTNHFHPCPTNLSERGRKFMNRNVFQIVGHVKYPTVKFVVCCSDEDNKGNIKGGTGQACRIAKSIGIQVINVRTNKNALSEIKTIVEFHSLFLNPLDFHK